MNWYYILVVTHIIGTALGVGAMTVGDTLFVRAVKKKHIDSGMVEAWKTISGIVWTGLVLLFISGVLFFVAYRLGMTNRLPMAFGAKFWLKMVIVGVLFVNGILMHWKSLPLLSRVASEGGQLSSPRFLSGAKFFFASGAISLVSWYGALMLGLARNMPVSFLQGLGIYILILAIAVLLSQLARRRMTTYITSS